MCSRRSIQKLFQIKYFLVKYFLNSEKKAINKMAKSIVVKENIKKNTRVSFKHMAFKSPGDGLKTYEFKKILNKKIKVDKMKDDFFSLKDF